MAYIDCEKLMSEVVKHPILYNQSLAEYKDNDRKTAVWTAIAATLECSGIYN